MNSRKNHRGIALVFVIVLSIVLAVTGVGLLAIANGARLNAIRIKNETVAMMTAEAGYEQAIFDMINTVSLLNTIKLTGPITGNINLNGNSCDYKVEFYSFIGAKPIYKITSQGYCGMAKRNIEVLTAQATGGWEMGKCRVPIGTSSTAKVHFAPGEVVDMPIHINVYNTKYDSVRDIHIIGSPTFLRNVDMGEARYSSSGTDKYSSVMGCFNGGINFEQPDSQINNESLVQAKMAIFAANTKPAYKITPTVSAPSGYESAVQLEFYVDAAGKGKVRITNNAIVDTVSPNTYDYEIVPGSGGSRYQKYNIYGTHYIDPTQSIDVDVSDTYITQSVGGVDYEIGGQIYVNGNVIIGGNMSNNNGCQEVKGAITVVATGNIWVADSVYVAGVHDASNNDLPALTNPNALGLIAGGVVKVIDPGRTDTSPGYPHNSAYQYAPIGITKAGYSGRFLPDPVVVEAAILVGGGGWGAEYVKNRKEYSGDKDDLVVHGTITEVVRGVVGLVGSHSDGFLKKYYLDERMYQGILPGDMWLKRKYIPTPAGWKDYRP